MSSAEQQASGIERTDLQRHDLSVPGYEVIQNGVDIGPESAVRQAHASGRRDHLRPGRAARVPRRRHAADDVQSVVISSAGHWLAEQAPEEMLAALTEFLAPYREGGGDLR